MNKAIKGCGAFLLWWIVAHLGNAFVVMDWSWLTEWEPSTRAINLMVSLYIAYFVWLHARTEE